MKYQKLYKRFMENEIIHAKLLGEIKEMLQKCSELYYNSEDGESPLTDSQFDLAFAKFNKLSKVKITTITKPRTKRTVDVNHAYEHLVGTTAKTNYVYDKDRDNEDLDTVEEWFNERFNDKDIIEISVSEKYDGNSIVLDVDENRIQSALSRGEDGKGADFTDLFKHLQPSIGDKAYGIKCEAMITKNDLIALEQITNKTYKKARSAVAGILSNKEGYKYSHLLSLVPLEIDNPEHNLNYKKEMTLISNCKLGNIKYTNYYFKGTKDKCLEFISEIYHKYIRKVRSTLDYAIDGLVISLVDRKLRTKLGRTNTKNNYDVALKFPPLEAETKVKDIKFYYSENGTGRVTPVVYFEKVIFDGAECENVSISNYKRFKELNLAVGDTIIVSYRNDVLSYLEQVIDRSENKPIKFISRCPKCGERLVTNANKTFVRCRNKECSGIVKGKIQNYLEKMGIKGIKSSTLEKLINGKLVTSIPDLYILDEEDIVKLEGFKSTSAKNIIKAIEKKLTCYDWEILGSLQIENFGRTSAKEICKTLTIEHLFNTQEKKLEAQIIAIEGFNKITAKQIIRGLSENEFIISELSKYLEIKSYKEELKKSQTTGTKYTYVFTGFRDKALQEMLELQGHKVTGSVSKNTNYLVVKDDESKNSGSKKIEQAIKLGVSVITKNEI